MLKQILEKFAGKSCWAVIFWCLFLILVPDCLIASPFPKIIIDEKVFNFKSVYEGEPIIHTFIVKNGGSGALVIEKVKPS